MPLPPAVVSWPQLRRSRPSGAAASVLSLCASDQTRRKILRLRALSWQKQCASFGQNRLVPRGRMLAATCLPRSLPANYNSGCDRKGKSGGGWCASAAGNAELLFRPYRSNAHIVDLSCQLGIWLRIIEECRTQGNRRRREPALSGLVCWLVLMCL